MIPVKHSGGDDRRKRLGGSDAAAVFGLSPWDTPLTLYDKKVSSETVQLDEAKRKFFARRKRQEPVVAEMLADEYGIVVTTLSLDDNPNRYAHPLHDYLVAEVDFEFEMTDLVRSHFREREDFCAIENGTVLNGEIKTVHPFKASEWGEQGSEEVPVHYAAQVMHGLGVTGRPAAVVAALFGLDTLLAFPVMADQELIAEMEAKCVTFWLEHVLPRRAPKPSNLEDFKRLYSRYVGRPVELDYERIAALQNILSLRSQIKQAEADLKEYEWQLASYVADAWGVPMNEDRADVQSQDNALFTYHGFEVGSWKRQRGTYLDQARLKSDCPSIVKTYSVEHYFRVLRQKKGKS